jgi:hypothetical protein
MEIIASLFVGEPLPILAVAVVFLVAWLVQWNSSFSPRRPLSLLIVSAAWAAYAVWEWLVITFTPEANIRADLLIIWPILLVVSIWFFARALRRKAQPEPKEKP